jgi:copper oxidase (laccase) domain-containing protein
LPAGAFCRSAKAKVIGAAHAGWRGALSGVLERTIEAMEAIGAKRANIHAIIGPTISQRAYEVGPEFMDAFLSEDPDHDRFFAGGHGDRVHFDLPGFGLHRLREAGVGQVPPGQGIAPIPTQRSSFPTVAPSISTRPTTGG